ncbi:hypothetical protein E1B28_012014 [Marasmius oreades]|uniref:Uncharacterized protein n=1 Tax=Marasmius oreades TaxID=181124 RepID=A0A9P7RQN6_9AGAR|nr:uncharacterized protein E1B28_012014 [Marasmius oreades]KAG7087974.1 hypothetical protein E1B28_012014 [Marasmius oreades]
MFNHSSSHRFGNATFNNVHGNQHIYHNHTYHLQHQHQLVPASAVEGWKLKMYREYDWFPTGRIIIIRTVHVSGVERKEYEDDPDHLDSYERRDKSRVLNLSFNM